jgi:hypothetical protein
MLIVFVLCFAAAICAFGLAWRHLDDWFGPFERGTTLGELLLAALAVASLATCVIAGMAGLIGWLQALAIVMRG